MEAVLTALPQVLTARVVLMVLFVYAILTISGSGVHQEAAATVILILHILSTESVFFAQMLLYQIKTEAAFVMELIHG